MIPYFKEDNSPDFWLSSRACPEMKPPMEFLAIYTHAPTVILGRAVPYSAYHAEEAESSGVGINRIFVLPPMCAAYLDEGVLTWTLFVKKAEGCRLKVYPPTAAPEATRAEVGEWTEGTFLQALIAWQVKTLRDLEVEVPPEPVFKLNNKIVGVTGVDSHHDGYLLGAGLLNVSVDHEAAGKLVTLSDDMRNQAGLIQLGYKVTKDQLRDQMAAHFEAFFGQVLEPASVDMIQPELDELKGIYNSESWIKYGEVATPDA